MRWLFLNSRDVGGLGCLNFGASGGSGAGMVKVSILLGLRNRKLLVTAGERDLMTATAQKL